MTTQIQDTEDICGDCLLWLIADCHVYFHSGVCHEYINAHNWLMLQRADIKQLLHKS